MTSLIKQNRFRYILLSVGLAAVLSVTFSANAVNCTVEGCVTVVCTENWCGISNKEGGGHTINCGDHGAVVETEC